MKKLFSFFTLSIIVFIGFLHHPIMAFSMDKLENTSMNMIGEKNEIKTDSSIGCKMKCCTNRKIYQKFIKESCSQNNENIKKTFKKIKIFSSLIFINKNQYSLELTQKETSGFGKTLFSNNKLYNYGYYTLIEIVKSNT